MTRPKSRRNGIRAGHRGKARRVLAQDQPADKPSAGAKTGRVHLCDCPIVQMVTNALSALDTSQPTRRTASASMRAQPQRVPGASEAVEMTTENEKRWSEGAVAFEGGSTWTDRRPRPTEITLSLIRGALRPTHALHLRQECLHPIARRRGTVS
jgi:hypothetical protein